jgi:hypothetical protein
MARHLHLVPAGPDLLDPVDEDAVASVGETNIVDLDTERLRRRRYRYHPAAGLNWLDASDSVTSATGAGSTTSSTTTPSTPSAENNASATSAHAPSPSNHTRGLAPIVVA